MQSPRHGAGVGSTHTELHTPIVALSASRRTIRFESLRRQTSTLVHQGPQARMRRLAYVLVLVILYEAQVIESLSLESCPPDHYGSNWSVCAAQLSPFCHHPPRAHAHAHAHAPTQWPYTCSEAYCPEDENSPFCNDRGACRGLEVEQTRPTIDTFDVACSDEDPYCDDSKWLVLCPGMQCNGENDAENSTDFSCSPFGNFFGVFGPETHVMRRYEGLDPTLSYAFELDMLKLDSWDGEEFVISMNGKECYRKTPGGGFYPGYNFCGGLWKDSFNPLVHIADPACVVEAGLHAGHIEVTLTSTLDEEPFNEGWAVDNICLHVVGEECPRAATCSCGHLTGGANCEVVWPRYWFFWAALYSTVWIVYFYYRYLAKPVDTSEAPSSVGLAANENLTVHFLAYHTVEQVFYNGVDVSPRVFCCPIGAEDGPHKLGFGCCFCWG